MRIFTQKQNQPQPEIHTLRHLPCRIGDQTGQRLMRASAENSEADPGGPVTALFAHDLSRVPVHSDPLSPVQANLTVNTPGDSYEQEADRVAERVAQMPE